METLEKKIKDLGEQIKECAVEHNAIKVRQRKLIDERRKLEAELHEQQETARQKARDEKKESQTGDD